MKLRHIKDENCKDCGSPTVAESSRDRHVSGQWNEHREYECGAKIAYSPNFSMLVQNNLCPNSVYEITKRTKRREALDKLYKYVEKLDIDKELKIVLLQVVNQKNGNWFIRDDEIEAELDVKNK